MVVSGQVVDEELVDERGLLAIEGIQLLLGHRPALTQSSVQQNTTKNGC